MFIGIIIGFFFGAASGFILFALISAAKENDDPGEQYHFKSNDAEEQPNNGNDNN